MKKLGNVLLLVAAITLVAPIASAKPVLCCGTNGSCEWGSHWQCWWDACPPGKVCEGTPGSYCSLAVGGCRLPNGDCIHANAACVNALGCTPDAACLMAEDPESDEEEVTWCDADDPEEEVDTPNEDSVSVEAEPAE